MICCSASIEVEDSSQKPQRCPALKDDGDTGRLHETETYEQDTNQTDEKEQPYKEEENASLETPPSADSPSSRCEGLCSCQLLANRGITAPGAENPLDGKGRRPTDEAYDLNNTEETADGLLLPNSSKIPHEQDACCHRNVLSKVSGSKEGALSDHGPTDAVPNASHQNPKAQKYISVSLPLWEAAVSPHPGDRVTSRRPGGPQPSSEDSDSDYELCPEITLTYTEEFSDDDLEYLECSDVMTDYSNALWQRNLQGTQCVFLLESDDEDMESSECCLGECEHFLSEMGCGPRVLGDTGPMEGTAGSYGHHSPQGVGVRSAQASSHSPSSPQTEMTLTPGPHQDGMSTVTDRGRYKLPTASEAAENDYPGIQGETRDSHPAGEEFACNTLPNVEKAVTGREMKRASGQLEQAGGTAAQKRVGEKDLPSRRGFEKSTRVRRPGMKGRPKKLKESATEVTPNLLYPKEPVKHAQAQSDKRESPLTRAEATDPNSQVPAGEGAISSQAEREATHLQTPSDSLPQDEDSYFEGEGVQVSTLFETSQVPDQSDHPQLNPEMRSRCPAKHTCVLATQLDTVRMAGATGRRMRPAHPHPASQPSAHADLISMTALTEAPPRQAFVPHLAPGQPYCFLVGLHGVSCVALKTTYRLSDYCQEKDKTGHLLLSLGSQPDETSPGLQLGFGDTLPDPGPSALTAALQSFPDSILGISSLTLCNLLEEGRVQFGWDLHCVDTGKMGAGAWKIGKERLLVPETGRQGLGPSPIHTALLKDDVLLLMWISVCGEGQALMEPLRGANHCQACTRMDGVLPATGMVQTQETVGETISLSQRPAFSEPAGEEATGTGTTADSFSNLEDVDEENAPLAQHVEPQDYAQGLQHEEKQERGDDTPSCSWEDLGHELSVPEDADMSPCELSVCSPQEGSTYPSGPEGLSGASPEPTNSISTLETVCPGSAGGEGMYEMEHHEAGDQGAGGAPDSPVEDPEGGYLPPEIFPMDFELEEAQSQASGSWYPDDETLGEHFQTGPAESPHGSSTGETSAMPPLLLPPFTWDISPEASEGATRENVTQGENFTSTLASIVQTGQEGLYPSLIGGHEGGRPLTPEDSSSVLFEEGGDRSPCTSAPDAADTLASQSPTEAFPQQTPTPLTAHLECVPVTRESRDTSSVSIAIQVHPAKHLPVSVTWDSHMDDPKEPACQSAGEDGSQLPPSTQLGLISNDSISESTEEQLCMATTGPGAHVHVPQLPEGEPSLQSDSQVGDKSQAMDGADSRSLEENFQEKGNKTMQEVQQEVQQEGLPHQGSLSKDDLQESLPTVSAVQEEMSLEPTLCSPANSREDSGESPNLGTSVLGGAEATTEDDSQVLSTIPLLSNILLEECKEFGPEHWRSKLKIITLEASISEIWSPGQLTDSECQESGAGPETPDRSWVVSDVSQADAASPESDLSETSAWAHGPQSEPGSALADNRDLILEDEELASSAQWSIPSYPSLSEPRVLESSVDPINEKELGVTDLLSEASKTGGKEHVNNVSQNQEQNQPKEDHPDFFKHFLACPEILESPVDPVNETGGVEWARAETPEPSESTPELSREDNELNNVNVGQRVEVQPTTLQVLGPQQSGEATPSANSTNWNQEDSERAEVEQSQQDKAIVEVHSAILQAPCPQEDGGMESSQCSSGQIQDGTWRSFKEAEQSDDRAELVSPTLPLSVTHASVEAETHKSIGQIYNVSENDLVEPRIHEYAFSDPEERGTLENERGEHPPTSGGLTQLPFTSSLEGNITDFSVSHKIEEAEVEEAQIGETKPTRAPASPVLTLALISGEGASGKAPEILQGPCAQDSPMECGTRKQGELSPMEAQPGRCLETLPKVTGLETVRKRPESSGSGHLAEGIKKKILSRVAALRLRLEEKENARKNTSFLKKTPKRETSVSHTDEKKDLKTLPCQRGGKAPVLLKKIQAEMFPDHPGNIKLSCQFAEIHEDSTIWWTRDSKSISQVQRSAGDNSTVSLAIVQASQKDQGLYYCCIKNSYGKVTAEFNLTAEDSFQVTRILKVSHSELESEEMGTGQGSNVPQWAMLAPGIWHLVSAECPCVHGQPGEGRRGTRESDKEQDWGGACPQKSCCVSGCEEIEFSQLIFKEDFLSDSYFGDRLRGQIATEALHFGEGVHRKAFRSRVMQGLLPVFQPGHACVLKVHNAVAYGTRSNDELVQRNYRLAAQECYVQNTARYYAKIYAAEAQPLEGFGEVPEIIPIFLIHRPENNIPYATVEEELIGEFVKYSMRDGKEINFLRRESEAGQKCCTFQHWVYQRTSGCLLVTDMQGEKSGLAGRGHVPMLLGWEGLLGAFKHLCPQKVLLVSLQKQGALQTSEQDSVVASGLGTSPSSNTACSFVVL
ncbi:Alpha-protein kinase 2 [Galemys pyrenaicus]|uniref:non-specific serine/threonine protein kinase n=1 Tax=Galemys pyrenaicus TaxID=202257 RepID=A0A8J5ZMB2_GALPY|nr:Alpha-protein kinase 2 [Galemys pyrenaicus]